MDVVEVRGRDSIYHTIEDIFELEVGDEFVEKSILSVYAHMRMHTAQHLVSGIAYEMFDGVRTVGIKSIQKNHVLILNQSNLRRNVINLKSS